MEGAAMSTGKSQRVRVIYIEALESRVMLLHTPELDASHVSIHYQELPDFRANAHIIWDDNNQDTPGTFYRVEWTADATGQSWPAGQVITDYRPIGGNALEATHLLDAGQKYYYRVQAVNGSER